MNDHVERRRTERRWYARLAMANLTVTPLLAVLVSWWSPESGAALGSASSIFIAAIPTSGLLVAQYFHVGHKENLKSEEGGPS